MTPALSGLSVTEFVTLARVGFHPCGLVIGSAVRANAAAGGHVPTVALSTVVLAVLVYVAPVLGWLLQPVAVRPRSGGVRAEPAIDP